MHFQIEFKSRAIKDLKSLDSATRTRIVSKIEGLEDNLSGDVKRLTNFTSEYRLRVGTYRILFEVEGDRVIIYRIKHRRDAYS
jgi:mRNA interferase RelE/StbE